MKAVDCLSEMHDRRRNCTGRKTFVFFGGGTGGHLAPAFAVGEAFKALLGERGRVIFFTGGRNVERVFKTSGDFTFRELPFPRPGTANPILFYFTMVKMIRPLVCFFRQHRVAACFGFGGYTSFPGIVAAKLSGVPVFLFEQNAVAGKVNRLFAPLVDGIFSSFPDLKGCNHQEKILYTGNPVRSEFLNAGSGNDENSEKGGIKIAVLGGSQGARALNQAMIAALPELAQHKWNIRFVHAAGPDYEAVSDAYRRFGVAAEAAPFFPDICRRISGAACAISRAGGSMVSELMTLGIPALLIPYPFARNDHQRLNGEYFERKGAALVCDQSGFGPEKIVETVRSVFFDRETWSRRAERARESAMPEAARRSASLVLKKTCGWKRGVL